MAFEKLRAMACFPELHDKICAGIPVENVAEWLQDEKGEYLEVQRASVVRMLYRYKQSVPTQDLTMPEGLYVHKKLEKLKRGLNELEELEKLYLLQLSRISMAVETEDKIKFMNQKLWKDVELAKELLLQAAKLKMEMGIYTRSAVPLHLTGHIEHTHTEFLEAMDPDRRRKLGEVAGGLLDAIKGMLAPPASETAIEDIDFEVVESVSLSDE